jgi:NADH-quinone oxidoreductase subunit F
MGLIEELAETVKDTTMCGLGRTASNPVLSTLRYFRHEYERHIVDKRCDAFVCRDLVGAPCQSACPLGTEAWRYVALIEKGEYEEAYKVIRQTNPFPSVCARVCDHKCESRCRLGASGAEPVAIRAMKRFITDRVDPSLYKPPRTAGVEKGSAKVAVVGAGPAGLTAAHNLSLKGYEVTLFEADDEPGGMLVSCIPAYRLPRDVLRREIASVFLAIGAHRSLRLGLQGEDREGVCPSVPFLKAFNLRGNELAKGRVGVIGGGNSAVDAARVAVRQKSVDSVTLIYRRSREEMPAFEEEIEACLEEGVELQKLVAPAKILNDERGLTGIRCIRNELGKIDSSGRPRPVPVPGTEFDLPLDTLIVAIGERPESDGLASMGIRIGKKGLLNVDEQTLCTNRKGVFAGGDLATGSNSVVAAIAAGRKAANAIDHYLRGEEMEESLGVRLPDVFLEPAAASGNGHGEVRRAQPPSLPIAKRRESFAEVETTLSVDQAGCEARRCLRCDLEFTQRKDDGAMVRTAEGNPT